MIDIFENYAKTVFGYYKGKVKYWLTFNEINAMEMCPYMGGGLLDDNAQNRAQGAHNQFVASAKAVRAAHEIDPEMMVGQMLAYQPAYAYTCDPADQVLVLEHDQQMLFYTDVNPVVVILIINGRNTNVKASSLMTSLKTTNCSRTTPLIFSVSHATAQAF